MLVGIDYSMSAPAIYVKRDDGSEHWYVIQKKVKLKQRKDNFTIDVLPKFETKYERSKFIALWVSRILIRESVKELNIESCSMNSSVGNHFDIGVHSGILYHYLNKLGIKANFIPPNTVKKYYTDNGSAGKDLMCEKFKSERGFSFSDVIDCKPYTTPENDMVDAYAIANCNVRLSDEARSKMFF